MWIKRYKRARRGDRCLEPLVLDASDARSRAFCTVHISISSAPRQSRRSLVPWGRRCRSRCDLSRLLFDDSVVHHSNAAFRACRPYVVTFVDHRHLGVPFAEEPGRVSNNRTFRASSFELHPSFAETA